MQQSIRDSVERHLIRRLQLQCSLPVTAALLIPDRTLIIPPLLPIFPDHLHSMFTGTPAALGMDKMMEQQVGVEEDRELVKPGFHYKS